jgi:hypothetical protein
MIIITNVELFQISLYYIGRRDLEEKEVIVFPF